MANGGLIAAPSDALKQAVRHDQRQGVGGTLLEPALHSSASVDEASTIASDRDADPTSRSLEVDLMVRTTGGTWAVNAHRTDIDLITEQPVRASYAVQRDEAHRGVGWSPAVAGWD